MVECTTYYRREVGRTVVSTEMVDVFRDWNAQRECWLFLAPHDDDIIIGAGLVLLAAVARGIEVHAVVTTDGRMGYCRAPQRRTISKIREEEATRSFQILGVPLDRVHFLHFPDCNLNPYRGRHFTTIGDPTEIEGASGLQNAYPYVLRKVQPTRVFLPTINDLHPDHRIVNEEMLISLFHAQGNIWPELGTPIKSIPAVYEYACYCDFPEPPQLRIEGTAAMFDTKLEGIRAYASQEQIEMLVQTLREAGPIEHLRELDFHFYSPKNYANLF